MVAMEENAQAADVTMGDDASQWKAGDRVHAVWGGNGCYYAATVDEVQQGAQSLLVTWDDEDQSHRSVPFAKVLEPSEECAAWSGTKIDRRATVHDTPDKGRCLYVNDVQSAGQVVFVEAPICVALPSSSQKLWDHLTALHEAEPLNLGTISFHFAALVSQLTLDPMSIDIICDKFVPDPDEDPDEDLVRVLQSLEEKLHDVIAEHHPMDPKRIQKLVSAWRYNSFGHHKENGLVLYNRISMCSHSCDPSCCWSFGDDDAFVLRARYALSKDAELTISYLQDEDLLKSIAARQEKSQNWKFTCACSRCSLHVDLGRGFRCRRCRVGILYATTNGCLEPCRMCNVTLPKEDVDTLIKLEQEYVARVETLDKTDVADVEIVYEAALDIFERHWILYVMDTMLWEAQKEGKEKHIPDAIEHQRRRIDFHEHYLCRPTFILAWCHEEFGDCLRNQFPKRKWHAVQEFQRAYQMLEILCGANHQYTASPYNKICQASS